MTVDRRQLERALQSVGLTKEQAERAVRKALTEMHSALASGRPVSLRSFGTLSFKDSKREKMWNPRNGVSCPVDGGRLLRFRPAGSFRRRIKAS